MNFEQVTEFTKELKRLQKKYKSLPEDLSLFKKILTVNPHGNNKHFALITERIDNLGNKISIYKSRFFCTYLKNQSLRIIYAYDEQNSTIHFLELYFKGEKVNEDRERIWQFLNFIDDIQR
jgi:hypothetical protein